MMQMPTNDPFGAFGNDLMAGLAQGAGQKSAPMVSASQPPALQGALAAGADTMPSVSDGGTGATYTPGLIQPTDFGRNAVGDGPEYTPGLIQPATFGVPALGGEGGGPAAAPASAGFGGSPDPGGMGIGLAGAVAGRGIGARGFGNVMRSGLFRRPTMKGALDQKRYRPLFGQLEQGR